MSASTPDDATPTPAAAASATMTVTLRYFAQVRRVAGESRVEREVPVGATAGEVAGAVLAELGLDGLAGSVVLAINAEYAQPADVLQAGDWLSLVPPVSGGAPPAQATVEVVLSEVPLDATGALGAVAGRSVGAAVLFQGTPRDVDALHFEADEELARRELARLGAELGERHGLEAIALHHRLGTVPAQEAAILVVAAAPHRASAFEAAREALDLIKARVPIWKAEVIGDASTLVDGTVVAGVPTLADVSGHAPPHDAPARLTHVAADGTARMVDVTEKAITDRLARATATVRMSPATAQLVADGSGPKGEVLATARLAGTMAAKRTAELVPLAHPLPLTKIDVQANVDVGAGTVTLESLARTTGKTGVEIEALTAALIAALTVYDMVKAVERRAVIEGVRVIEKAGGRHDFRLTGADDAAAVAPLAQATDGADTTVHDPLLGHVEASCAAPARQLQVAAVHVSTSRTAGDRPDRSRAALAAFAERTGWHVAHEQMVADDRAAIAAAIRAAGAHDGVEAVLTLGGTGLTPDDVTPEATLDVVDREIPGLADALRAVSLEITPLAALSRATAGAMGRVAVVNLPGSPKALGELEPLLTAVLPHAVDQIRRDRSAT